MSMQSIKETLETHQVSIYFCTVIAAALIAVVVPGTTSFEPGVNPALALMLFVTFLQVPISDLGRTFSNRRFLIGLLVANFIIGPLLVLFLSLFLPADPMLRLGVFLVLLTPCIDYVVTFSHLGRADARLLLGSTPVLLIVQIILLPVYLRLFLGDDAARLVRLGPFIEAFFWLIAIPLVLAAFTQTWAARSRTGERVFATLGLMPVPATAMVLFIVIAAVLPQLGPAINSALRVVPIYVAFAVLAPILGWLCARTLKLEAMAGRAIAFSAATRNSLVVLPLAFAVPGAVPVLPAVIVTQTLVELVSELVYIRLIAKLGRDDTA